MKFIISRASNDLHNDKPDIPPCEGATWNDAPWRYSPGVGSMFLGFWTIKFDSLEALREFIHSLINCERAKFNQSIVMESKGYDVPEEFKGLLWITIYDDYIE